MPPLKDLHIRITSKCNFNCQHCYAAEWFKNPCELDFDTVLSAIAQAQELGCKKVTFTGGEPLVSTVTLPAAKFCLENGLRVEIETNGVLIDKAIEKAKDFVSKIEFAVSYEGDKMRDSKYTARVLRNIEDLKTLGCDLKLQTVLTPLNRDEVDTICSFSKGLEIKHRIFLAHSPNGNGKNVPLFSIETWLDMVQYLKLNQPHVTIELPDLFSGGAQKKCGWGVYRCELMPNGDVTSCAPITFNKRDFIAGNVQKQPLKEIWRSSHFEKIRQLSQSDFHGLCAKCPYWKTCLGACRSISLATEGHLLAPHPFCVTFFDKVQTGTLNEKYICSIANAKEWLANVTSKTFVPSPETLLEIVTGSRE